MLPNLSSLDLLPTELADKVLIDNPRPLGASWAWSEGKYAISFSLDVAVAEQIDGLGRLNASGDVVLETRHSASQLRPLEVLKVVREHAIQRLWDIHCAAPQLLDYPPIPKPKRGRHEPWPSDPSSFVETVARWVVRINRTPATQVQIREARSKRQRSYADDIDDADDARSVSEEVAKITNALTNAREEQGDAERAVLVALLRIEEMLQAANDDPPDGRDTRVATFLVKHKKVLLSPGIGTVRRNPIATWYGKPLVQSAKLIRWWKMCLVLGEGDDVDTIDGAPFEPSALVPSGVLDGSFYSGKTMRTEISDAAERVSALSMEHIVPVSHMANCELIKECVNPTHLAMVTTMATRTENSQRNNLFLPLGKNEQRVNEMKANGRGRVFAGLNDFTLARRQSAARMLCAGYLTLPMLERAPDGTTELGARPGGVYEQYRDDIWELMKGTIDGGGASSWQRTQFQQAWMWEAGLSLVQWHMLGQPFNPLPNLVYRQRSGIGGNDDNSLLLFWKDLLFLRLRASDVMAKMFRLEMREEVTNAPLSDEALGPGDELSRAPFISALEARLGRLSRR